ncbi:MAG: FkbM family methyltransferase [Lachnospiraceae bacterium]
MSKKLNEIILNRKSVIPEIICQLQKEKRKLILLGCGGRGGKVYQVLKENKIHLDDVVVEKQDYRDNLVLFGTEIPVHCLDRVLDTETDFNVILGVSRRTVQKPDFFTNKKIHQIYDVTFGMGSFDGYSLTYEYYKEHEKEFEFVYERLEDERSRELYAANINGRITNVDEDLTPSEWQKPQYFFQDMFSWEEQECLVDCGAYDGDTVQEFLNKIPKETDYRVFAFEPDEHNYKQLRDTYHSDKRINTYLKGVWREKTTLKFSTCGNEGSAISNTGMGTTQVEAIDDIIENTKVTFIKMDVEGSELQALYGARNTILRDKPRLGICLYHLKEDVWKIPQYVLSLLPEYKIYIRTHSSVPTALTMFAIYPQGEKV